MQKLKTPTTKAQEPTGLIKLLTEMGPLLLFFAANSRPQWFHPFASLFFSEALLQSDKAPIFIATMVLILATVFSLLISWFVYKHIPVMPLVSGVVILTFGGLTLVFQDDLFIKLKPTIINVIFGVLLLGSLFTQKLLLPFVFGMVFQLDRAIWRKLTLRWGLFFLFLAVVNELVWRTQSTDFWVAFKVWGMMPLNVAFMLSQMPLIMRHATFEDASIEGQENSKKQQEKE